MLSSYSLTISSKDPLLKAASSVGNNALSRSISLISGGASQSLDRIIFLRMFTILAACEDFASLDLRYSLTFHTVPTPVVYPTPFFALSFFSSFSFFYFLPPFLTSFYFIFSGDDCSDSASPSDGFFELRSTLTLFFSDESCPMRSINRSNVPFFTHCILISALSCLSKT